MALVNDKIVEVGFQSGGGPALLDRPSTGAMRNRKAADAASSGGAGVVDQDVPVCDLGRLHDTAARPLDLPELLAVGRGEAGRTCAAQHQDLGDSVNRRQ